jgi:uncharacterized membrane protein YczE
VNLTRRLLQLYAGLVLYGSSMALQIRASLGLDPWDVFHQGLAEHLGLSFGTVTMIVGAAVLLLWIPLRQLPGLGTVSNVFVIGLSVDAALSLLPAPHGLPLRFAVLAAGIVLNGLAGGLYIGARFGPGPRDGLMTGLSRRTGRSVRLMRTSVEVSVLVLGLLMGGTVGLGTVAYALAIGPLVQFFLPLLTVPGGASRSADHGRPARSGFFHQTKTSVLGWRSENRPVGEASASSRRSSASKPSRPEPNRCGAEYDIENTHATTSSAVRSSAWPPGTTSR